MNWDVEFSCFYRPRYASIVHWLAVLAHAYGYNLKLFEVDSGVCPIGLRADKDGKIWGIAPNVSAFLAEWADQDNPVLWALGFCAMGSLMLPALAAVQSPSTSGSQDGAQGGNENGK